MLKRLIFNADDYGRTAEVSAGIRYAHLKGVVTSTSCMMTLPGTVADIQLAKHETPHLGMGVHLTLTAGNPLGDAKGYRSIISKDGKFHKVNKFMEISPQLDIDEIKAEWRAQVNAFINASGCLPTHLDSHHHSSYATPEIFEAMVSLAVEYKSQIRLPVGDTVSYRLNCFEVTTNNEVGKRIQQLLDKTKVKTPDGFFPGFYDNGANMETLLEFFQSIPSGTYEVMCHPGYYSDELGQVSSYNHQRQHELEVLTDPILVEAIRAQNIGLIHFGEL